MSVQDELDVLRNAVEDCQLVAFVDLESRLTLVSSSAARSKREALDALCASAADFFAIAEDAEDGSDLDRADTGGVADETGYSFFVRNAQERGEALAIVCGLSTDPSVALREAHATLARIQSPSEGT